MYNNIEVVQDPNFEVYDITTKLSMIYMCIIEYSNLLLSNERKKLLIINQRGPQTTVDQTHTCEKALNNFAL